MKISVLGDADWPALSGLVLSGFWPERNSYKPLIAIALWKKDEVYDPNYKKKAACSNKEQAARDRSVADLPS